MSEGLPLPEQPAATPAVIERAFGSENRTRLLEEYFTRSPQVSPMDAWRHIYALLLWIDPTTGLAHCYESDKSQPGRPWYDRTVSFHGWLCEQFHALPRDLGGRIDWLFNAAIRDVRARGVAAARRAGRSPPDYPVPGEDPGLAGLVCESLAPYLASTPTPEAMLDLSLKVRDYYGLENKRKNLVGEGFEDVLSAVIRRLPGATSWRVLVRPVLHAVPGFREHRVGEKPKKVDLVLLRPGGRRRVLVTAKWSVRADREEQFASDFEAYSRLEHAGEPFDYVLVTNEFDAARLVAACDRRRQNDRLFEHVVHVNPEGPLIAYGQDPRRAAGRLRRLIDEGRLQSLTSWLTSL